ILIIEFAKDLQAQGKGVVESALAAAHLRFRPIVMTSMAFGLGVLPLALATGAGSGAQRAIGTGVLGGMMVGTLLGLFFVPLFFVVVQRVFGRRGVSAPAATPPEGTRAPDLAG
ncbi:MAG TPA: efflux RND transporter permease subunit, partial [Myxococcaceae bacterium]|nr:efflux RND transporter permease subunit [Myxococcaceae bacterium]